MPAGRNSDGQEVRRYRKDPPRALETKMTLRILEPTSFPLDDPESLATQCIEGGCDALLLDEDVLPAEFFDLSTRLLGTILHRLDMYRIRLAAVVPDVQNRSGTFQDFVRESNAGNRFRFFASRAEAMVWLESLQED